MKPFRGNPGIDVGCQGKLAAGRLSRAPRRDLACEVYVPRVLARFVSLISYTFLEKPKPFMVLYIFWKMAVNT